MHLTHVYILVAGAYGQYSLPLGVFSSREKAEKHSKIMGLYPNLIIVEETVDIELET